MHVVRGTCTLEQAHISNSHLYMLSQGELVLALPQPELSGSHSGTSFRTHALPRQEPSTLCHLENHVGRAIMFFTCKVRASERLPVEIKHLVFMEEVSFSVEVHCTKARLLGRRIQVSSLLQHATQPCVLRGGH